MASGACVTTSRSRAREVDPLAARSIVLSVALGLGAMAAPAEGQAPPNFVVILADDMGYGDLGPYDHDEDPGTPMVSNTPVLDQMASEGVRLTNFYASSPVCSPTRAALLTGRHHTRFGLTGVFFPDDPHGLPESEITLAELLQSEGYATGLVGKWHLGDLPEYLPENHGFGAFYGVPYSNDMLPFYVMRDYSPVVYDPDQSSLTQDFIAEAQAFITGAVAQSQPFFLYLPFTAPHVPVYVSSPFQGATGRGLYADCIFELDSNVGQLLAHIASLGIDGNTCVVFTSDNGPWDNTHGPEPGHPDPWRWVGGSAGPLRGSKAQVFEGGLRVPFVARWPGQIPPGLVVDEPAICMDLFTTLAAFAGAEVPADRVIDGRDLSGLLTASGGSPPVGFFFYESFHSDSPDWGSRQMRAMRSGKWKLHFDIDSVPVDLYDLELDVGESTPVVDPAQIALLWDQARDFNCRLDDLPLPDGDPVNFARYRPVVASSSLDCNTSSRAVDGDLGTIWESATSGDEWIYVDLGIRRRVRYVLLRWGAAYALQYQIDVSADAATWTTVHTADAGAGGSEFVALNAPGRFVRMRGLQPATQGYALEELGIYSITSRAGGSRSALFH